MKTLLILLMLPIMAFAQNKYEVVGDTFNTTIRDGRGKDVPVSFSISSEAKEMILASPEYATTQQNEAF